MIARVYSQQPNISRLKASGEKKPHHPLKQARMKRNLTQQALADFAMVSLSTIQRAETGSAIRVDSRKQVCEFLQMTPEELGLLAQEEPDLEEEQGLPLGAAQSIDLTQPLPLHPLLFRNTPSSFQEGLSLGQRGAETDHKQNDAFTTVEDLWAFLTAEISPEAVKQQTHAIATMRLIAQEIPLEKRVGYLVGYLTVMFAGEPMSKPTSPRQNSHPHNR